MRPPAPAALVAIAIAAAASLAACRSRLPDQDLRILSASPAARLSADLLWKDYAADGTAADRQYWGKPIVVTGRVTAVAADASAERYVVFGELGDGERKGAIRANLLDEQAQEIVDNLPPDRRISLKCFCEGLQGDVILKSCVKP